MYGLIKRILDLYLRLCRTTDSNYTDPHLKPKQVFNEQELN